MAAPINRAAWQKTFKGRPFVIEEAPMPNPRPDQIIVKTRAIGINPADAAVQKHGMVYDASQHPLILGLDIAGEVYKIGSNVTNFHPGDRVCGYSVDMAPGNENRRGSFQLYCAVKAGLAAKIPDNVSFSEAAVFPSCFSVAAYSMFLKDTMSMELPPLDGAARQNGQIVVIWGGSSVVGSCAIQMARLAGYEVVATASEMNFQHCRDIGATRVFDYKSASVMDEIIAACQDKTFAGVFVAYASKESTIVASKIASQLPGTKIIGTVVPPHMGTPEGVAQGVKITANWGPDIAETKEGQYLFQQWITPALADGRLKLSPRPEIAGKGLEALQGAVDTMSERLHMFAPAKTISPRKIVVEIE